MGAIVGSPLIDAIFVFENRPGAIDGIKLLLFSLEKYWDQRPAIHINFPHAPTDFEQWLERFPTVELFTGTLEGPQGFNIKPRALMTLLDRGYSRVMWIDSDIVLCGNIDHILSRTTNDTFVVAEEPAIAQNRGGAFKTKAWSMEVGRDLGARVNGGIIICGKTHRPLLESWYSLLTSSEYLAAQSRPWNMRPAHMIGDQEVLEAILGSRQFSPVPVQFMRSGRDIVQLFGPGGFGVFDRLRCCLGPLPPIIHSMGRKPWDYVVTPSPRSGLRNYYDALHCELSPYTVVARKLASGHHEEFPWLERSSLPGAILSLAGAYRPSLIGLPLAAFDVTVRKLKRLLGLDQLKSSA